MAAVLSPTRAIFLMVTPCALAISMARSRPCAASLLDTGEVWKTYLKPRSVMVSAKERVIQGIWSRSETSVAPIVKELSHDPEAPTTFSRVSTRWAAPVAFSTLSPASVGTSTIFAPPRALIPPWPLISSMAISAPYFMNCPWRAQRPERGATRATFTSAASAAAAMSAAASGPAPHSTSATAIHRPTPRRIARSRCPLIASSFADRPAVPVPSGGSPLPPRPPIASARRGTYAPFPPPSGTYRPKPIAHQLALAPVFPEGGEEDLHRLAHVQLPLLPPFQL